MSDAYVDTSVLLSFAFREATSPEMGRRLSTFNTVYASALLEAELRSACRRDQIDVKLQLLDDIEFVFPPRTLSAEIKRVLDAGYVRGADCWHLATALFLAPDPSDLTFITLDVRQREVAAALGFAT